MQINKVKVICIGSALVDTIASSPRQIDWGDDVPGYITSNVGGVAFNICQQLALSQLKEVELLTALGKDAKGRKIIKDGVIPEEIVNSSKNFRPEMVGFVPPQQVYAHICGTDLIRDDQGNYLVLEDNARCPSGASYLLENREIMKRAFPQTFGGMSVRSVEEYPDLLLRTLEHLSPRK
ncbi:MAG: hypothetical protein EBW83_08070, partial [Rhodobacterales bacterium]|nr:hypothetical protein [Rhodobacterales bacterium]